MSLNGLDSASVIEAYEAAVAEPGGWSVVTQAFAPGTIERCVCSVLRL